MQDKRQPISEEKAARIAVGATVAGVLLVLFLVVVLIIQFVQIGVHNRMEEELDEQIARYEQMISDGEDKILSYLSELTDERLLEYPAGCDYSRFTLILAQFRHLHSHMGMLMGFIIDDTWLWPRVLGLENPFPEGEYSKYL